MMDMNGAHGKLKAIILVSILIISGLAIMPFIIQELKPTNESAGGTWYNNDWNYMKQGTITNATENYSMLLNITYISGKMKSDFSDLRFLKTDNATELYHWYETIVSSTYALVWINISNCTVFNMYYGNDGISSYSTYCDGNKTFPFFDGFYGSALNTTKWGVSGTITYTVSGGELVIHTNTNGAVKYIYAQENTYGKNYAIRTRKHASSRTIGTGFDLFQGTDFFATDTGGATWESFAWTGSYGSVNVYSTSYQIYDYERTSSACYGRVNGVLKESPTTGLPTTSLYVMIGEKYAKSDDCYGTYDWILVRKRPDTEPTNSFGSETSGGAKSWYNSNWMYCKKITIDHTKVAENLTNFPVLFSNISADFKRAQSNGNDFIFMDAINTTKYNHEIETFNSTTGALTAWVNITSLSNTTDTVLWLYYGNSVCSSQQNKAGTWNSNYKVVYHMNDLTTSTIADSTSNANDGTKTSANNPIEANAKMSKGQTFAGDDYITKTITGMSGVMTVSGWAYTTGTATQPRIINFACASTAGLDMGHRGSTNPSAGKAWVDGNSYANTNNMASTTTVNDGVWHYIIVVKSTSTQYDLYVDDGAAEVTEAGTDSVFSRIFIGERQDGSSLFTGTLDEIRISNTNRSANWIATEYNNQNSPSTFMTLGNEVTNWYNTSFPYRIKITIDHNKVSADMTNFPVLVKRTMNASRVQSDGDDLLFTSSGGTKLNHEIEAYNSTSGELVSWVNVTYVAGGSTTPDTYIYLYYGNTTCSSQQNIAGTWDSNYKMVQHMNDITTSTTADSTSNKNNGTKISANHPVEISSVVAKGQDFTRNSDTTLNGDYITFSTSVIPIGNKTVQFWVKRDYSGDNCLMANGYAASSDLAGLGVWATGTIVQFAIGNGGTTGHFITISYSDSDLTNYQLWTMTYDGTTERLYKDGTQVATSTTKSGSEATPSSNLFIGQDPAEFMYKYSGDFKMDEVRISNASKSANWISTEYKNQNDPANFTIYSAEEQYGGAGGGNTAPNTPTGLWPTTRQVVPSVTIYATATDPESDAITMYFYDNATGTEINGGSGHQSGASGSNISITWSGLSQGISYSFYAKAYDGALWSANSSVCTFTTNAPPVITGLMTENQSDPNRITNFIPYFNWTYTDNESDAQVKYHIEVGSQINTSNIWNSTEVTSASNNAMYGGSGLSRTTTYYVRVRVFDGYEWSGWQ